MIDADEIEKPFSYIYVTVDRIFHQWLKYRAIPDAFFRTRLNKQTSARLAGICELQQKEKKRTHLLLIKWIKHVRHVDICQSRKKWHFQGWHFVMHHAKDLQWKWIIQHIESHIWARACIWWNRLQTKKNEQRFLVVVVVGKHVHLQTYIRNLKCIRMKLREQKEHTKLEVIWYLFTVHVLHQQNFGIQIFAKFYHWKCMKIQIFNAPNLGLLYVQLTTFQSTCLHT